MSRPERPFRLARILPWMAIAALGFAILSRSGTPRAKLELGSVAPALEARLSNGERFHLGEQIGSVVVLNFWATWCPPCRAEAPELTAVHRRLLPKGGKVIGIAVENVTLDALTETARRWGMEYPVAIGASGDLDHYQVEVLPTTYVIAPDGRVSAAFVGGVTAREMSAALAEVERGSSR